MITFFFLIVASLLFPLTISGQNDTNIQSSRSGEVYAVIIGISKYQDNRIRDLEADKNALKFKSFLTSERGGKVPEDHIRLLVNEQATAAAIKETLARLPKIPEPDDTLILFFSGHAGEYEIDISDVYLLTADSNFENPTSSGIGLSEIRRALAVSKEDKRFIIFLDTPYLRKLGDSTFHQFRILFPDEDGFESEYWSWIAHPSGGQSYLTHLLKVDPIVKTNLRRI